MDELLIPLTDFNTRWGKIFKKHDQDNVCIDVIFVPRSSGLGESRKYPFWDGKDQPSEDKRYASARLSTEAGIESLKGDSPTVFMIRFSSKSNSRLSTSERMFNKLMKQYSITPRVIDHVMCYGFKVRESDFAPPGPRFRTVRSRSSGGSEMAEDNQFHDSQGFEIVYGFRYVVKVPDARYEDGRWATLQSTVYQKFDPTLETFVWMLIGPSEQSERCMQRYLESISDIKPGEQGIQKASGVSHKGLSQALATHILLIEGSMAGWRWYIADLTNDVYKHSDHALLADVVTDTKGGIDHSYVLKVEFSNRQELKQLEDYILNLQTMLKGLIETISTLRRHVHSCSTQLGLASVTDMENSLTELYEDARMYLIKAEHLYRHAERIANLLSDLLSYENTTALKSIAQESKEDNEYMRHLTAKATEDSKAIKVITIITVFFLPATVVAVRLSTLLKHIVTECQQSFFSTVFVDVDRDDFSISSTSWIYFAVTVPLTGILIIIWWLWVNKERILRRRHNAAMARIDDFLSSFLPATEKDRIRDANFNAA
ncbi:MAG: hypothetical protein M1822_004212 [Bathelium mastoideum]|nr:MAG: hypothetical protein M1822_004212 [Bathelium mastoideum]